jgi:NADPH-dependent glutamate synthase beta subunit-like oxidoreductase
VGDDNNRITHLEYLKMELGEPDDSGRRRPVPIEGSETQIELDMLITAIGQGPDISFKEEEKQLEQLETTRWNTIDGDPETLQSSIPYIFSAGDAYTGASLVVEAIGGGRRAARAIHQHISGEEVTPVAKSLRKKHIPESIFEHVDGIVPSKRAEMPELPVEQRIKTFEEADLVLSEENALKESHRCLYCCRICYNKDEAAA